MKATTVSLAAALAATACLSLPASGATVLLDDSFSDGDRLDGADLLDAAWLRRGSTPALSIETDSATSGFTGNALRFQTNGNNQRFLGYFNDQDADANQVTELAVGDRIALSLDVRFASVPSQFAGVRFGLYDSNGTRQTADAVFGNSGDNFQGIGDDNGFYVRFNPGAVSSDDDIQWEGDNTAEGAILGGSGNTGQVGTDFETGVLTTSPVLLGLEIERVSATSLDLTFTIDGVSVATRTRDNPDTFAFDQVVFGSGGTSLDVYFGNISVVYTPIPEPVSVGAVATAGLFALRRRRS